MGLILIRPFFYMSFDIQYFENEKAVIGCDEVGRGPLAGPVVACAVMVQKKEYLKHLTSLGIMDSKKLTSKKRQAIIQALKIEWPKIKLKKSYTLYPGISFVLEEVSPKKIDQINILQASLLGMKLASEKLSSSTNLGVAHILVDGNKTFHCLHPISGVVKGDSKSLIIGLASIIAKEFRDEKMKSYDELFPGYFFSEHAGYPTAKHREAIAKIGITPIHRKSFKGVKEYL
tara:strand:- start:2973 stop:3665 length:693 start_codon:yes stop_codon:yes gene_type:complete